MLFLKMETPLREGNPFLFFLVMLEVRITDR